MFNRDTYRLTHTPYQMIDSGEDGSWQEFEPQAPVQVWQKKCSSDRVAQQKAIRSIKRRLEVLAECDDDYHLTKLVDDQWVPIPLPHIYIQSATLYVPRWLEGRKYSINWDRMSV